MERNNFKNSLKEENKHEKVVDILSDFINKFNLTVPNNAKRQCIQKNTSHYKVFKSFHVHNFYNCISKS